MKFSIGAWGGCISIVGLLLNASPAQAYTCKTITTSTTLTIPNLSIPQDTPDGTRIGNAVATGVVNAFNCVNDAPFIDGHAFGVKGLGAAAPNKIMSRNVYKLGNSGIGYTVMGTTYSVCNGTSVYVDGSNNVDGNVNNKNICGTGAGAGISGPLTAGITLEFYKIGALRPGRVEAQSVGALITQTSGLWQNPESVVRSTAFTVTSQGCTVSKTSIQVPMGASIHSSNFSGVGSTTGTQAFAIPLSCDAGVRVSLTVSPGSAGAWNAANGLLNLDTAGASSVAGGVKLQILSQNRPLVLNSPLNLGTRPSSGVFNIPLTARYYQSGATISGGQANATATFTLKYE